jgi:hypothetical protein
MHARLTPVQYFTYVLYLCMYTYIDVFCNFINSTIQKYVNIWSKVDVLRPQTMDFTNVETQFARTSMDWTYTYILNYSLFPKFWIWHALGHGISEQKQKKYRESF